MESQTWGPVVLDAVQVQKISSLSVFLSYTYAQIYLIENLMLHDSEL